MTAEYETTKSENWERLVEACTSKLKSLQESGRECEFDFYDSWRARKHDVLTSELASKLGVTHYSRGAMYVQYFYKDGEISAKLFQGVASDKPGLILIQENAGIQPEDIPFQNFTEGDLKAAANKIDFNLNLPPK